MSAVSTNSISYQSNFKKIIEVLIFHEFYQNKICKKVDFSPNAESKLILRNYGLLFKQTGQGFVIIQNLNSKTDGPTFKGPITLCFDMLFKDILFLNMTKIPFQYNQLISFTNETAEVEYLHGDPYVGDKDIQTYDGNGIAGKISLTLNQSDEFFGERTQSSNFYQYKIFFDSRTFVLRYNFYFSSKEEDINKFYVLDEKDGKRYENFTARKLENEMDVFSLEFSNEIKLKEKFDFLFYLKKDDEFDKAFSKFLPHPEPKNLSFDSHRNLFIIDIFNPLD
ncbi:MAG: hypothetical protein CBD72_02175 [Flavobacteriaceae bacterium TMED212]|nr:MAG: hypothetical protein CBD72_02175 [Flavobacteriaceae bacterium TMED212]|tara:strand:+ start:224 stop:1063 length:840 start_codon:yes stop_codon:yes gene_type:complete